MPSRLAARPRIKLIGAARTSLGFQVLAFALSSIWSILLARGLGPEARGTYAILSVIVTVAATLSGCGFGSANVYYRARGRDSAELAGTSLVVALLSAALLAAMLVICLRLRLFEGYFAKNHITAPLLWIAIGVALCNTLYSLFNNILLGSSDILGYNLPNVVYHGSFVPAVAIAVFGFHYGVHGAACALLFSTALTAICLIVRAIRNGGRMPQWPRFRRNTSADMSRYAAKAYSGTLCQLLSSRVDSLLVGYYLPPMMVGQYAVAAAIADRVRQLPSVVGVLLVPRVASAPVEEGDALTVRVLRLVLITEGGVCLLLALLASAIVAVMFGPAYHAAALPLLWLMPGALAAGVTGTVSNAFAGRGMPEAATRASMESLCLFVAFAVLLIPRIGVSGAGIAWSFASIIAAAEITSRYFKVTGMSWKALVPRHPDLQMIRHILMSTIRNDR